MSTRRTRVIAMVGVGLAASLPLWAHADDAILLATVTTTTYLNGGIGRSEEAAMHRVAHEFPLRIAFSERKDGEFLADVPVVISDAQGNPVFQLPNAGPMLYVMLPHGRYKVSARFKGRTETQEVALDAKGGKDLYFHWNAAAKG